MKICTFMGHGELYDNENVIKEKIDTHLRNMIEKNNVMMFLNGAKGRFDWLCAECVHKLKKDYPEIISREVLAYMPRPSDIYSDLFDETTYPELEHVPLRFAISKRNQWMVDNSDFAIAYVKRKYGGAYTSLKYAKRRNIVIINIADELN